MKRSFFSVNILLLIVLALIWGSSYILMKKGLVVFSAVQVSMLRIIFACIALLPFLPKAVKSFNKKDFGFAVLIAVLGSGIPSYLYPLAITKVDSSVTGIINALTPVFTVIFGWAFFKMKPTILKITGIGLALLGAGLLILQGKNGEISISSYALIAVLATICYGFSTNILKSKLNHVKSVPLTSLTFSIIGPIALGILMSTNFIEVVKTNEQAYLALLYVGILGVVGTALALVLFNYLIKRTDVIYATSVTFLIPIVALAWGAWDGESVGWTHLIGMFAILLGVYLSNRKKVG